MSFTRPITLLLLLTTLAGCSSSGAGSADSDTDTEGATGGDLETDNVDPGLRLLFPTGEWGVESGYMVVEAGPGGHASHALPLSASVDVSALKPGNTKISADGRWAYLCLEHEDGSEFGAVYSLAGPMGAGPTLTDLGALMCSRYGYPVFADSGQAAFFPDASDGLWISALDTEVGTPVHLDTPAGGPTAKFVMRPGRSEALIYHDDSMWWHPGVPTDVQPRLLVDGWLWAPTGESEFAPRFIDGDRVLLWRDRQPLVATLHDGELRDVIEVPAPANDRCDDPLYLSGTAEATGAQDVTGMVCRPRGSRAYVVELRDPAGEPWVLGDGTWELQVAASSSDGRWLAFIADYPGEAQQPEDGLYIADRTTRATPVFVPRFRRPTRAVFCGSDLFATAFDGLLHVGSLDTDAPQATVLETIEGADWLNAFDSLCLAERGRLVASLPEAVVAVDLDTLNVDILVEADEDESVWQLRGAPDGSIVTYFRHRPFCEDGCPASLSIVDLLDDSTTELVVERIPRNAFKVDTGPLAR